MTGYRWLVGVFLVGLKRDKVLWALFAVALLLVLLVPAVSLLSMRQVQELAVSLSLSGISLFLLISTVFLGATSIWRDIERRFAVAVFTLPVSRQSYMWARYTALGLFLLASLVILGGLAAGGIVVATLSYPSDRPLLWVNFAAAVGMTGLKYLLLLAVTFLLASLSTSFFLPAFGAIAVFMAGNASLEVYRFVLSTGNTYPSVFVLLVRILHYLLPNFEIYNVQVYAIYGLPMPWNELGLTLLYTVVYGGLLLMLTARMLKRREL
jgi:Cu-processing system permease protein